MNEQSLQLLGLVLGIPLGLIVATYLLQAAIAFCGVEDLRILKSFALTLLRAFAFILLGAGALYVLATTGWDAGLQPLPRILLASAIDLPIALLLGALFLSLFLKVGYARGLLIELTHAFIGLVITGLVVSIVLVVLAVVQLVSPGAPRP